MPIAPIVVLVVLLLIAAGYLIFSAMQKADKAIEPAMTDDELRDWIDDTMLQHAFAAAMATKPAKSKSAKPAAKSSRKRSKSPVAKPKSRKKTSAKSTRKKPSPKK